MKLRIANKVFNKYFECTGKYKKSTVKQALDKWRKFINKLARDL